MRLSSAGSARDRRILRIQSRRISIRRENTRQATQLPKRDRSSVINGHFYKRYRPDHIAFKNSLFISDNAAGEGSVIETNKPVIERKGRRR